MATPPTAEAKKLFTFPPFPGSEDAEEKRYLIFMMFIFQILSSFYEIILGHHICTV